MPLKIGVISPFRSMERLNYDPDDDEDWITPIPTPDDDDDDDDDDNWEDLFPEYSQESKNAGRFIGLNHPYIPGDPGL